MTMQPTRVRCYILNRRKQHDEFIEKRQQEEREEINDTTKSRRSKAKGMRFGEDISLLLLQTINHLKALVKCNCFAPAVCIFRDPRVHDKTPAFGSWGKSQPPFMRKPSIFVPASSKSEGKRNRKSVPEKKAIRAMGISS